MNEVPTIEWLNVPMKIPDAEARETAEARQAMFTKPPRCPQPSGIHHHSSRRTPGLGTPGSVTEPVYITGFLGDHGMAAEGVRPLLDLHIGLGEGSGAARVTAARA